MTNCEHRPPHDLSPQRVAETLRAASRRDQPPTRPPALFLHAAMSNADAQRYYWAHLTPKERAARGAAMRAGKAAAKAERARADAFIKKRKPKPKPPKAEQDKTYDFKHIRRAATPDAIPAMPTLAEALGC